MGEVSMKIFVCIGSSCHIKGAQQIVEQLQYLIEQNSLIVKIELSGAFCMGTCMEGVCVKIQDKQFSLKPEDVKTFFDSEVLGGNGAYE